MGSLADLRFLYLHENQLDGNIPTELGGLASLETLQLNLNELTGTIPSEFGNLSSLQSLDLSDNQLAGPIPPELGNLSNLEELDLADNGLTGTIPAELSNLPLTARQLDLRDNHLFTDDNSLRTFLDSKQRGWRLGEFPDPASVLRPVRGRGRPLQPHRAFQPERRWRGHRSNRAAR